MKYISLLLAIVLMTLTSCQEQYVTYSDKEYIMFSDTLSIVPVEMKENSKLSKDIRIPVVSTVKCDYDRTLAVEILDNKSNAIESKHYTLSSNTVVIKAGETSADVVVNGIFDSMEPEDSLCFTMSLIMKDELEMPIYGRETRVQLRKVYPFNTKDFTGWYVFTSMFHREFNQPYQRLVKAYPVEGKDNTIRCHNMFNDGYDVELCFDNTNVLNPLVKMPAEQIVSDEASIFGQTLGDNHIRALHSPLMPSNFYTARTLPYFSLWSMLYVQNLGENIGTVGHFYSIMERITEKEARRLGRDEALPGFFEE